MIPYHPQRSGEKESFSRIILQELRHYEADRGNHWNLFTDILTYASSAQRHRATKYALFEPVLSPPSQQLVLAPKGVEGLSSSATHFLVHYKQCLRSLVDER